MPKGVTLTYGGDYEENGEETPHLIGALLIAIGIIYFILIGHFKRISTATLLLLSLSLCFFGTAAGIWIQGVDLSMTCILGIVSLMGILVRNGIIMIDYAEELRSKERMSVRNAIYYSAKRRMRPIFLTSAAASVGVIPMILGGSGLWMPMGTVIFYGTLITMVFILTVLPVSYWMLMKKLQKQRLKSQLIENEFA
jgi:multidrug efflux pump subunit AcrB